MLETNAVKNDPNLKTLQKDQTIMLFLEDRHKVYEANKSPLLGT